MKLPDNIRHNLKLYKKLYNVIIFKKLLYKYDFFTSLKIVSQNYRWIHVKGFLKNIFEYIETDLNFDYIYQEIKKVHKYNPHTKHKLKTFKKTFSKTKLESFKLKNEKIKQTCKNKDYTEITKKVKKTKLEKYGDPNYCNFEKISKTKLEKYGNSNYNNIEKCQQTKLEKYGEIFTNSKKCKQTKLEKYGNSNYNNIEKCKQTKLERYGNPVYVNPEKMIQTNIEKYGCYHNQVNINDLENHKNFEFIKDNFIENNIFKFKEFIEYFNISKNLGYEIRREFNITEPCFYRLEYDFLNMIETRYKLKLEKQYKIGNYHVDGFDEETNTIFEFLGDYWHGNPKRFESNKLTFFGESFGDLYNKTFNRFSDLSKLGYKIKYIWESDYLESDLKLLKNY